MIEQREEQLEELRLLAMSNKGIAYDGDKVQHSAVSGMPAVDRYLDQAIRVKKLIDKYVRVKNRIIGEIQQMDNKRYTEILYKRYVECKSMQQIAEDMSYEYKYLCRLHSMALIEFQGMKVKNNHESK